MASKSIRDLIDKANRQEAAKFDLLIAAAEGVAELLSDKGDEWNNKPYKMAERIHDLINELKQASE